MATSTTSFNGLPRRPSRVSFSSTDPDAVRKTVTFKEEMSDGEGRQSSIPVEDNPISKRDRRASLAWVDLLTDPSKKKSPCSSDNDSDDESTTGLFGTSKISTRIDDAIFDKFSDDKDQILVGKFLAMLESNGLKRSDYRIQKLFQGLKIILKEQEAIHRGRLNDDFVYCGSIETLHLSREVFRELILPDIFIISTAYRSNFIIPKFDLFCQMIEDIYLDCKDSSEGVVAPYLNKLAHINPNNWGVSMCTIDGQRYSVGDTQTPVTMHALSKPLMYAYALQEIGKDKVHKYVGQEPSGHRFNELVLDHKKRPHNPIINAGSIMIHGLLQQFCHPEMTPAERFDATHKLFERLSGETYVGFSNGMFLNKREASDRNWALGFFMKEHECFPPGMDLNGCLEYYLQTSSLETTMDVLSVIASTLANGGICPITGQRVLSEEVVADVLSVMFSCGMLEFSGKFAFRVGLPAKSCIAGAILLVIPNVGGFAVWSPPLDKFGNSVRGLAFCERLVQTFNFHCFDVDKDRVKIDPTRKTVETRGSNTIVLKFSAAEGDLDSIFRLHLCGVDMGLYDCDGRTALHVAACEGHYDICLYLLRQCGVKHDRRDRWGNTPYDEAVQFGHADVADLLRDWHPQKRRYSRSSRSNSFVGDGKISRPSSEMD